MAAMDDVMVKERDEESGRYTETYPLSAFREAVAALDGAATTQEVADEVGCAYRTAHAKLTEADESGLVASRRVGRALLWYLPDE
ncbi:transcriptional regulator [Halomarina pelagica]|uniref:transcriptional regulator n=1 Tax=Halomarina pelagica TaxID=2961599 RepID=UPI0020C499F9|nr:transcriptional regulator [Halomarina sp. BND7]